MRLTIHSEAISDRKTQASTRTSIKIIPRQNITQPEEASSSEVVSGSDLEEEAQATTTTPNRLRVPPEPLTPPRTPLKNMGQGVCANACPALSRKRRKGQRESCAARTSTDTRYQRCADEVQWVISRDKPLCCAQKMNDLIESKRQAKGDAQKPEREHPPVREQVTGPLNDGEVGGVLWQ